MVRGLSLYVAVAAARRVVVDTGSAIATVTAEADEVCCLCFEETGTTTNWKVVSFPDDPSAALQGASFMDCRRDQGDGTSKCAAACAEQGFEMKGCNKGAGMSEWRENELWATGTWSCETDADAASCGCPEASLIEQKQAVATKKRRRKKQAEVAVVEPVKEVVATGDEVCCLCFEETGTATNWKVVSFPNDPSAELQGASFMDCRKDQGDGTSKCATACAEQGFEMKGCNKGVGMSEWRENELWATGTWNCETDADAASCGCPVAASLVEDDSSLEQESVLTGTKGGGGGGKNKWNNHNNHNNHNNNGWNNNNHNNHNNNGWNNNHNNNHNNHNNNGWNNNHNNHNNGHNHGGGGGGGMKIKFR